MPHEREAVETFEVHQVELVAEVGCVDEEVRGDEELVQGAGGEEGEENVKLNRGCGRRMTIPQFHILLRSWPILKKVREASPSNIPQ